jgi:hypothetical protein
MVLVALREVSPAELRSLCALIRLRARGLTARAATGD